MGTSTMITLVIIAMVLGAMAGGLGWHWYLVKHYNQAITIYKELVEKQEDELNRYKYEVIVHDEDNEVTKHVFYSPYLAVLFMQTMCKSNRCTLIVYDRGRQVSVER